MISNYDTLYELIENTELCTDFYRCNGKCNKTHLPQNNKYKSLIKYLDNYHICNNYLRNGKCSYVKKNKIIGYDSNNWLICHKNKIHLDFNFEFKKSNIKITHLYSMKPSICFNDHDLFDKFRELKKLNISTNITTTSNLKYKLPSIKYDTIDISNMIHNPKKEWNKLPVIKPINPYKSHNIHRCFDCNTIIKNKAICLKCYNYMMMHPSTTVTTLDSESDFNSESDFDVE